MMTGKSLLGVATAISFAAGVWLGSGWADSNTNAPSPEALKNIGPALGKVYTSSPFHPAMTNHLWMDVGEGRVVFLHFNKPASDPQAGLIFVGEGIKGRFCAEDQPDGGKTGFVHFHRAHTPEGETGAHAKGHGGNKGEEGYGLKHIAVGEFDMMGKHFTPGTAMNFMATPAPRCNA